MTDLIPQTPGQLDIFGAEVPYVPTNGTETSAVAAAAVKPSAAKMREAVLEAIRHLWPCTDEAVAEHLGWDGNSVRPRRIDLVRRGEVVADGRGLTRKGNPATTWKPTSVFDDSQVGS